MVRVFVVELVPLAAALFVAMRSGLASLNTLAALPSQQLQRIDLVQLRQHFLPGLIGSSVAVVALTLVSGILALLVAYPVMHGFTPWALPAYTRLIGQVFDPVTALVLLWKVAMFGLTIGLWPVGLLLASRRNGNGNGRLGRESRAMAVLLASLLVIEMVSLSLLRV
jgi:phospholipid/cholesterol/gamma-HCH transport system permease protein